MYGEVFGAAFAPPAAGAWLDTICVDTNITPRAETMPVDRRVRFVMRQR
jgi:hypothetical protein